MFLQKISHIPYIAAAIVLSACASIADDGAKGLAAFADDPRLGAKTDQICFSGSIDSFYGAKDNTIVLSKGLGRDYRVSLSGMCGYLERAQSIAFERQSGCARRGDFILVSESVFSINDGSGLGPDRCYIDEIYKWDKKAVKRDDDLNEASP